MPKSQDRGVQRQGAGPGAVPDTFGSSPTAAAFGASTSVPEQAGGLVLVVGRGGTSPVPAVMAAGGNVLVQFPEGRVLAAVSVEAQPRLQRHPDVALAGPVDVDPSRFAAFAKLIGRASAAGPGTSEIAGPGED